MSTRKTYFLSDEDTLSWEQLASWEEAPTLDKSVYFPLILGVHLRRLRASEVASKMAEWFADADREILKGYLKIELEQLLRPDYLDSYAEAKTGGWLPFDPLASAHYAAKQESTTLALAADTLGLAFAGLARKFASATVVDLNETNKDRVYAMQQRATEIADKTENQIMERFTEAVERLEAEIRRWKFDSAQLIPNVHYALKWLKKRCKQLASTEDPATKEADISIKYELENFLVSPPKPLIAGLVSNYSGSKPATIAGLLAALADLGIFRLQQNQTHLLEALKTTLHCDFPRQSLNKAMMKIQDGSADSERKIKAFKSDILAMLEE